MTASGSAALDEPIRNAIDRLPCSGSRWTVTVGIVGRRVAAR